MKKLQFKIQINAPVEKVWNTMLDDKTYREWTEAFHPGSYYDGSWEVGSTIRFIGPNDDGTDGGMLATVVENIKHQFVSLKHIGMIMDGKEDTTSPEVLKWAGALENYTFSETNDVTEVIVDLDANDDWVDMFEEMWPRALAKLKEIAEAS